MFIDVDLDQIKPGMSKKEVKTVLGSPDTTSTIGGDAYYYISTTQKTVAFLKPHEIDRQVVAVYFDGSQSVQQVAHYGMKDGIVVNYYKGETPARGKDLSLLEQIFGNLANRRMFKAQSHRAARETQPASQASSEPLALIGGRAPPAAEAPRCW